MPHLRKYWNSNNCSGRSRAGFEKMNMTKRIAKNAVSLLSIILISPVIILYRSLNAFLGSDSLFAAFSQLLGLIPGKTGNYLRASFYRFTMKSCSRDTVISFLVLFAQQDTEISSGVYIGPNCNIGSCKIGRNTLFGSSVHIISGKKQHNFDDPDKYIKDQQGSLEKISIGEDCWIGNGAIILASIGDKCIVGAGSVVVSSIPPYSIVAGNPCRIVGSRKKQTPDPESPLVQ